MHDPAVTQLIADIGGTSSRLAVIDPCGDILKIEVLDNDRFESLHDILQHYLDGLPAPLRPDAGVLAVASPIMGDEVVLTNRPWRFSLRDYRTRFGFEFLHVINDFVAVALAVPVLKAGEDYLKIGEGEPLDDRPIGVIGPGTGLGVSVLVPVDGKWVPIDSEGGHVTLAAANAEEERIIARVRQDYPHVSAERLVSGPGLSVLYQTFADLQDQAAAAPGPAEITRRDADGADPLATRTIDTFMEMLGTVAGNLALTTGARGGIYLAGGILPRGTRRFSESGFRRRFIDKGRYRKYLDAIPTYLVVKENVALTGLAAYLRGISGKE